MYKLFKFVSKLKRKLQEINKFIQNRNDCILLFFSITEINLEVRKISNFSVKSTRSLKYFTK